jgi:competence protein ComEC
LVEAAVLRYWYKGHPKVLLAGDLDGVGLEHLLRDHPDPQADVLVFPHHGGHPEANDEGEFARLLSDAVQPKYVVFSMERSRYNNPLKAIVEGVRSSKAKPRIACTQLSTHCLSKEEPAPADPEHLSPLPAKGKGNHACCAGTMRVDLAGGAGLIAPAPDSHQQFVDRLPGSPLCRTGPEVVAVTNPVRDRGGGPGSAGIGQRAQPPPG